MIEWLKAVIYGIVEGISEWLPVSSTGHLIVLERVLPLDISSEFRTFFLVVIQLGAVLAALLYFAKYILSKGLRSNAALLLKIVISCAPAALIGVLFDDWIDAHFYNYIVVSIMLVLFGIVFLVIDRGGGEGKGIDEISISDAAVIGVFQAVSAVFPGVSRSGSTIIGGLIRGLSRRTSAEYTFIMSIPVMMGASLLKLIKLKAVPTASELSLLAVGSAVAFVVSLLAIDMLMKFVRRHSFKIFGYYRILLGALVIFLSVI